MTFRTCLVLALALIGCGIIVLPARAQTILTIGGGFRYPNGLALDGSGNLFAADFGNAAIYEIQAAGGYVTVDTLPARGFVSPGGVALDAAGNVYVADSGSNAVYEILAAGGYAAVRTLASGFKTPSGVAVDAQGDVFVAESDSGLVKEIVAVDGSIPDPPTITAIGGPLGVPGDVKADGSGNVFVADAFDGVVKEILAAGGYVTVQTLGPVFTSVDGVALDGSGNVFVVDGQNNTVSEMLAAGGYTAVNTLIASSDGFNEPTRAAVDGSGNVFVADTNNSAVKEIMATPPMLLASVLPDSRSVLFGDPATVFASVINSGATALDNCRVALSVSAPAGLTLNYRTTDPATNALTGSPDTPGTIAGNGGLQTFLVSLQSTDALSPLTLPLDFVCDGAHAAAIIQGVDTVDLAVSSTPVADIIALAATPTNDGIIDVPVSSSAVEGAAFAVASSNLGATTPITVSVDTGDTVLYLLQPNLCQTDPATGQCLAAPSSAVTLSYAGGATPTFSIFLQSYGQPIAFAPASSRIYVRFKDASGALRGSTSVAVRTQ
jgi:sugar lactone lactonase YvrE